ncbi:MAG TPA: lysophospholipid acyltransferase family protein [Thermoguttaceae bacterium]|nr:lysophospholipid acyltransferase family protein [Thermoguttaceae bacterium]
MEIAEKQPESAARSCDRAEWSGDGKPSLGNRVWYELTKRVLQLFLVVVYRVRRGGIENIPAEGPVLLTPNHQSHFDPPLVGCCCPRRVAYVARKSLFKFAPFAWFIRSFGAFPIDRDGRGFAGIKETLRRLKRGEIILIFPEGARTHDGQIATFRPGIRTLALRSGATIVPVAIEGAYQAWPRSRAIPGSGTIHIHFGEAIMPDQIRRLGEDALVAEVERRVRDCHALVCNHPIIARNRRRMD